MASENIKFNSNTTVAKIALISTDLKSKLTDKKTEYDNILAAFSVSECMQATAMRNMIAKEKEFLDEMVNFYTELLIMLKNASGDINKTEQEYSSSGLTN